MFVPSKQAGFLAAGLLLAAQIGAANAQQLAFYSDREGNMEVFTMNADGTGLVNLTNHPAADGPADEQVGKPVWSPDGRSIAFTSNRDGDSEIYLMEADGTNQRNLSRNPAADSQPHWSPDGTKLVFISDRDGYADIWVMAADGANPLRLLELDENTEWNTGPRWSPDGSKIVFSGFRKEKDNPDIWLMNADGTNPVNVFASPEWEFDPDWSPDSRQIVFWSAPESHIRIINLDGTIVSEIGAALGSNFFSHWPDWSPDGRQLAITLVDFTSSSTRQIAIIDLDNLSEPRFITDSACKCTNSWPDWAPTSVPITAIKAHTWGHIKADRR